MALIGDTQKFTPDANRFGESVARTNRILAKLLLDWTEGCEPGGKVRPQFLTAIYFDKLAELFCRLWEQLKKDGRVRFPPAYKSFRGIHGPGRGMVINRQQDEAISLGVDPDDYRRHRIAYTTEIMEKLGPTIGPARPLFELSKDPPSWHHGCRVFPQLAANQWESWLEDPADDVCPPPPNPFLTPRELDLVNKVSEIVTQLTKEELRALGTHAGVRDTIRAVEFNRRRWEQRFAEIVHMIRQRKFDDVLCTKLIYIAREVRRKAITNQADYRGALEKLRGALNKIGDTSLEESIARVQSLDDTQIWGNATIQRYAEHADEFVALSECLQISSRALPLNWNLGKEEAAALTEAWGKLGKLGPCPEFGPSQSESNELDHMLVADGCESMKAKLWEYLPPMQKVRSTGVP